MKTLTELSGTLIRVAAKAIAEARRSLPQEEPEPAAPAVAEVPAEAQPEGAQAESGQETPAPAPVQEAAQPKPEARKPVEVAESDAIRAALDVAVGAATGLAGDRLARLRDAVKVVGRQVDDVRLVRVYGAEEPVQGAKAVGGFQFVVDLAPSSMRQTHAPKKEHGRGPRGGGGGGGGGRGGGGGGGGGKASATGGFSMDSLRDDRKGSGGPGGRRGGGKKLGGGRPGGGPAK